MKQLLSIALAIMNISLWGQVAEPENQTCKPLPEVFQRMEQLDKAAQHLDVWDWDVHYYLLDISIDIPNETITGRVEVQFNPLTPGLENIQLDLTTGMTVDSVYLNGASFNHYSDILSIVLDGDYDPGETVAVGIAYHGHPVENGFKGFDFQNQYGQASQPPMISTLSEPYGARTWWPCKDVPTDKADSIQVRITVDETLTAVSNGLLMEELNNLDGTKTWVWEHKYPISTYLISLAVTDYHYWSELHHFADGDSMPLEYWVYPSYASQTNVNRWNLTGNMVNIYSAAYGKYPFATEKYGMAQFEWGGAMEHQTCSSMGASGENTIAHELSHQWWGDLVTCANFHHIWLNEGFATYSEALYWGAKNGEAAYHAHMATKDQDYNGSIYRIDTTSISWIFNYIVYGKGAWTLHMLRHVLGDDAFFETLADYRETYQFSHVTTEDFQAVAESVYGDDLGWFFDQWIYGSGRPVYEWWWRQENPDPFGNSTVHVRIEQTQNSSYPLFRMPIDLHFQGSDLDTTVVVWDSLRSQEFTLELAGQPATLAFDEAKWIYKYASQVAGVDQMAAMPGSFQLLDVYPNPFNAELTITYLVQSAFQGSLTIFDITGSRIYNQTINRSEGGRYTLTWNGQNILGEPQASGIYLIQLSSSSQQSDTRKVSLLK